MKSGFLSASSAAKIISGMKPGILISRLWSDDDVLELEVRVSDGKSSFSNQVYVAKQGALEDAVSSLQDFKAAVYGGLLDLQLGEFGPEFANGAFHARFHFTSPGRLFVTCKQESDFVEFAQKQVASKATLYLKSEPALLDRFIVELDALATGKSEEAELEGI